MDDDDLCYMPAHKALALFARRDLSPVELTTALIDRAEAIAETVNPFADQYFDEALTQAEAAEAVYASASAEPRALEGIPLSVKDSAPIKGRRATKGSLIHDNNIAQTTDPGVERLLEAGAILLARTTLPEFGWLFATHSRLWGITRNPWRLDATPGGSSGGSAAALAAGVTTLATGGDSTGSIRQPAGQCGIVGYKPPEGRIPLPAPVTFDPYLQTGPMTRGVAETAMMTNIMAGPHPLDHHALPPGPAVPGEPGDIAGLRVAYSIDLGHHEVIGDVRRETLAALDALAGAGAVVEEVDLGDMSEIIRLAHGAEEFLFSGGIEKALAEHPDKVSDYVPELATTARSFTADDYRRSLTLAGEIWHQRLGPVFEKFDALVCPSVSCPEVPADNWQKDAILVNGRHLTDTDTAMTVLFNMYSRCAALAVPSGMTDAGLPTGLQIVGRPHDEVTPFRLALALEQARPWLHNAAHRPSLATMTAPPPAPRTRTAPS